MSETTGLTAAIEGGLGELKAKINDAIADRRVTLDEATRIGRELLSFGVSVVRATADDEQFVGAMTQLVGGLYDDFIEPLDLPGPDSIVDPMLRTFAVDTTAFVCRRVAQIGT